MSEEMKKAGFNVELKKWNEFKKVAKENNSDTNKELRKFVEKYLEENKKVKNYV